MQPLNERDPRQVGQYEIVGRLGSGAMGRVFLGRGPDGKLAAIKLVHENLASETSFRERFRREVNAARRVSGPRTAAVLDADPEAAQPWMAVEYVEGPNLEQQIRAHGPLASEHIFWLAQGIALALGEIHRAGVIHRDLKPTNVLLSPTGPRVIDFGIARSSDATALTTVGLVTGSPAYMSPEQATSGEVTQKSDVFCLGAVLFFAATGHPVYGDGPPAAMLYRVVHNEPDLSAIRDDELRSLIEACLRKVPEQRPGLQAVADYGSRPAGTRDLRMLAAPLPPRPSAYSPTEVIGPAGQATQVMPPQGAEAARTQYLPPETAATQAGYAQPGATPAGAYGQPGGSEAGAYGPGAYGQPAEGPFGTPTRIGDPAAAGYGRNGTGGPGGPGAPGGPGSKRGSSFGPALVAALVVLLLLAGGIFLYTQKNNDDAATTADPQVSSTPDTRAAQTTAPEETEPEETTPEETTPSGGDTGEAEYLYQYTSGVLGALSGGQRSYNQDGVSSQNSTSFRAGCSEDDPWETTFTIPSGVQRVSGTLVLDPAVAPEDLEVEVVLYAGDRQVGHWKLKAGEQRRFDENLRDADVLKLAAAATDGTCGNSVTPYGVIVDGAYS